MVKENNLEVALAKELCIICTKEMDGPIIMNTILNSSQAKKVKDLHSKVIGFAPEPCPECQENLKKAFFFIGFNEKKSDMKNLPEGFYRTGHLIGVKKDIPLVIEGMKEHCPSSLEKGYVFMPYEIMKELGLITKE